MPDRLLREPRSRSSTRFPLSGFDIARLLVFSHIHERERREELRPTAAVGRPLFGPCE
jgi:hypothetical protein